MLPVTDLRAGTTFEEDGQMFQVISYEHIKMGRGSANIKIKVRNLKTGSTVEKSYINGAKVKGVTLTKKDLQYLYKDQDAAYFMDPATFEQVSISLIKIPDHKYLKDGDIFNINILDSEPLSINMPPKMVFKVIETGPSVKGNSATNVFKDAILENGIKTKVPLFVNMDDKIRIDTRTGAYTEKAS